MTNLHAAIMNLPETPPADITKSVVSPAWYGYQIGHRDARHAAAELVSAAWNRRAPAQSEPAAPTVVEPAGKLHYDGYFTWKRRDGYVLDKQLPCDFYLAAPAATPPRIPLPDELQLVVNLLSEYGLQALDVVAAFKGRPPRAA